MEKTVKINEPQNKIKKFFVDVVDIVAFFVFIVWIFLAIKVFVIAPVIVKGHSMLPNYKPWEYIFIDKFYYKIDEWLKRGDVVVVMPETSDVSLLKRVVGLPWENIAINSWEVYVCKENKKWDNYLGNDVKDSIKYSSGSQVCKKIKEPYIDWKKVNLNGYNEPIVTKWECWINEFKLGSWQYLVFGDDRMYSTDSRCCFERSCSWEWLRYYIKDDEILWKVRSLKF